MKKIDLHTHTVSTVSDYPFEFSLPKFCEYAEKLEMDAIAITNHNVFDLKQFYEIQKAVKIPIFPGIEIDLEGGHILVISDYDDFEIADFDNKCKQVSSLVKSQSDYITLQQFNTIFPELNKYLLIPHYDKGPEIRQDVIDALQPYISAGEVASISKFKRAYKNTDGLVPVLFSDVRFRSDIKEFPTRHIFVDLKEITFAGIRSCLHDRTKIALTKDSGNDFFQATEEGLLLSTSLNIIMGERSSGKTVTLDKISASCGNVKYIKQFSLLQNDEERFNDTNKARLSLIHAEYLSEYREVIEDVVRVDIQQNHIQLDKYLTSLIKFATENEKKDLFSKCVLFNEDLLQIDDLANLNNLIKSVSALYENNEYQSTINKHLPLENLRALGIELLELAINASRNNNQRSWINTIINDIKRELRIKTTSTFVEDIDFYKIILDEKKVERFIDVTKGLQKARKINVEELGKFSVITSTQVIESASDMQKIGRDKKTYSTAFSKYQEPYEYILKLKEVGVEDADLYKFFVKIEAMTYNKDGFTVSGGERSEFNLIHEIQDATKYDILLIDEPESSFDNLFLKREINTLIKDMSMLMPVVVVTHNSTVGASIKPNYIAVTKKTLEDREFVYKIYSGYPSDKVLTCLDESVLKNYDSILDCLEAGHDAYDERKNQTYDILKN